eukprot:TRINITY_DN8545_c0_g1_i1.p1 TRINITY_DN8545_c0_g1~~TRINITY_DN8545_c0_g1_i1.p1  ORF type:complete len:290 (+),score=68.50 TRINITY_DN8545_c0_g1_i1:74-943(+)
MRVLSIQSHVVHGYVGNKASTFPLQVLGFDVDAINSVQFSNHTGYPVFRGQVLNGDELWALIEGLDANGLLSQYTHLLTGYIGSVSFLQTVLKIIQRLRERNPDLIYVCDPVMGDDGKLYVAKDLVSIFREQVIKNATILTPNQFECEQLTELPILSLSDAIASCQKLHDNGIETVVITSLQLSTHPDNILTVGSKRTSSGDEMYLLTIPKIPSSFSGTGDLMAALLLAGHHRYSLKETLEKTTATLQAVLRETMEAPETGPRRELRLVQSKKHIENPPVNIFCTSLDG